jgi:hypothetical protein
MPVATITGNERGSTRICVCVGVWVCMKKNVLCVPFFILPLLHILGIRSACTIYTLISTWAWLLHSHVLTFTYAVCFSVACAAAYSISSYLQSTPQYCLHHREHHTIGWQTRLLRVMEQQATFLHEHCPLVAHFLWDIGYRSTILTLH